MKTSLRYALALGTFVFLIWRGIGPAFERVETDFPNYYTASRLVLEGRNLDSLYNDAWFQERMQEYGITVAGKFSPFPPTTALIMLPLARLSVLDAQRVWTGVNIALLIVFVLLLSRILGQSPVSSFILVGMSGLAIANDFRFGQFYLVIAIAMAYSYKTWEAGRTTPAAVLTGIMGILKYFPLVFLVLPIIRREFRMVVICLVAIAVGILATMVITGPHVFLEFLTHPALEHAAGQIQNPYSSTFQSWGSLARRLFLYDAGLNPTPLLNSIPMYYISHYGATFVVAGATLAGVRRTGTFDQPRATAFQFALICVGGLLASPATATYHFLLLALPAGLLLRYSTPDRAWNIFFAVTYASIGFIPYSLFKGFEGSGLYSAFAYPRLWLLSALFAGILLYIERIRGEALTSSVQRNGY